MPVRYKIDYRWNTQRDLKKVNKTRWREMVKHYSAAQTGQAGRSDRTDRGGGGQGPVTCGDWSVVSIKKSRGLPLNPGSDLQQPQTTPRATTLKVLGVIDPNRDLHTEVEKDYLDLHKKVEAQVERRRKGVDDEAKCRVGGRVEEEQRRLDTLTRRLTTPLPLITQDNPHGTEPQKDNTTEPENTQNKEDNPPSKATMSERSPPPANNTTERMSLSDISGNPARSAQTSPTILQAQLRDGPTENNREMDKQDGRLNRSGSLRHSSKESNNRINTSTGQRPSKTVSGGSRKSHDVVDTSRGDGSMRRCSTDKISRQRSKDFYSLKGFYSNRNRGLYAKETSKNYLQRQCFVPVSQNRLKGGVLKVEKKPLSWRADNNKKEPELVRSFDLVRTVHQHYPDTKPNSKGDSKASRQMTPLSLNEVSPTPSCLRREHSWFSSRIMLGMTPENKTRPEEVPLNGKPPSPTFQIRASQAMIDGKPVFWKPVVSRFGNDPFAQLSERVEGVSGELVVEGRSSVTFTPSKVMLKVVLPRGLSSGEDRWCGRKWTSLGQENFRAWLTYAPSPPPPPPPSAPMDTHRNGLDDGGEREEDADNDDTPLGTDGHLLGSICPADDEVHQEAPVQQDTPAKQPSASSRGNATKDRQPQASFPEGSPLKPNRTQVNEHLDHYHASKFHPDQKEPPSTTDLHRKDTPQKLRSKQPSLPHLNLGPRMTTAESTFHADQPVGGDSQSSWSCWRSAYCDLLGPRLCPDCEAARHRLQFSTRQELLYPDINVFPRHMVASQKLQSSKGGGVRRLPPVARDTPSGSSRWPYVSSSQLKNVITELDLCQRVVRKSRSSGLYVG